MRQPGTPLPGLVARRLAVALLAVIAPAGAVTPAVPPGAYAVSAQIVMPHLDGMRRQRTTGTVCLGDGPPDALFGVLRQYALRGCTLGHEDRAGNVAGYVLVCASARVAGGTARVVTSPSGVTGTLAVRMGGKNMTFSQQVTATRTGDCAAPSGRSGAR